MEKEIDDIENILNDVDIINNNLNKITYHYQTYAWISIWLKINLVCCFILWWKTRRTKIMELPQNVHGVDVLLIIYLSSLV